MRVTAHCSGICGCAGGECGRKLSAWDGAFRTTEAREDLCCASAHLPESMPCSGRACPVDVSQSPQLRLRIRRGYCARCWTCRAFQMQSGEQYRRPLSQSGDAQPTTTSRSPREWSCDRHHGVVESCGTHLPQIAAPALRKWSPVDSYKLGVAEFNGSRRRAHTQPPRAR